MFVEKTLPVREIVKTHEGLVSLINAERIGDEKTESNRLPLKTAYRVGRFSDQLESAIKNYTKQVEKARKDATDMTEKYEKDNGPFENAREKGSKNREFYNQLIEEIEEAEETVKVLSRPINEKDFGSFKAPAFALKQLGEFVSFEEPEEETEKATKKK